MKRTFKQKNCKICNKSFSPKVSTSKFCSDLCLWESKVEKTDNCWLWKGFIDHKGYGSFKIDSYRNTKAHRFSYTVYIGPIPIGLFVCHTCDTPSCVNPEHLFIGLPKDNSNDMKKKNRSAKGESHSQSKLTEKEVLKIRKDVRLKQEIAEQYNIAPQTVLDIKTGRRWGWLNA